MTRAWREMSAIYIWGKDKKRKNERQFTTYTAYKVVTTEESLSSASVYLALQQQLLLIPLKKLVKCVFN